MLVPARASCLGQAPPRQLDATVTCQVWCEDGVRGEPAGAAATDTLHSVVRDHDLHGSKEPVMKEGTANIRLLQQAGPMAAVSPGHLWQ